MTNFELEILSSVFGSTSASHTTPTPLSTPLLGDLLPGQSFGGPVTPAKHQPGNSLAQHQVKRSLAWSTATRYLSLDGAMMDQSTSPSKNLRLRRRKTREVEDALDFILNHLDVDEHGRRELEWDLISWYSLEVRNHFLAVVITPLERAWAQPQPSSHTFQLLERTIRQLQTVQTLYLSRLDDDLLSLLKIEPGGTDAQRSSIRQTFLNKLHDLFLHALPSRRLASAISMVAFEIARDILGLVEHGSGKSDSDLFGLLEALQNTGLGGAFGQRAFATAMYRLLDDFVVGHWMKVDWSKQQSRMNMLNRFVTHGFSPFVKKSIVILGATPDEACQYHAMALGRLGRGRIANLLDYIAKWDQSAGAIKDIKEYTTTPEARLFLTTSFAEQLQRRLLHAGATTTHILDMYINTIHVFNELDPKGVLLDRVARPVRKYLRHREDTARIIVASLLADLDESGRPLPDASGTDISVEIAKEMAQPILGLDTNEDAALDFDDLEWTPDPIDISPEFKRSKSRDVTSALLSLYDREDFISELKTILGEHLLRNYDVHEHFEKEERLLELFKNRLGEDKLQACEVMLRDVQSSHQMNKTIQRMPGYAAANERLGSVALNTQILSSFFWPSLRDDEFHVPGPIKELQESYAKSFEAVKDMRKLRWLSALGRVTVELDFDDRTVEEEVPTWTASVIYAFEGDKVEKSISQLEEELQMDEQLVRNAIAFWRAKQVLQPSSTSDSDDETYTVIESLSSLEGTVAAANSAPILMEDAAVSAVKTQEDLLAENAELYKSFIVGMLTNRGNVPLMQMLMMMKVVVPGGFPFGMDEVRGLCQELVDEGKAANVGGDVFGIRRD